jgi:hypothetical protein
MVSEPSYSDNRLLVNKTTASYWYRFVKELQNTPNPSDASQGTESETKKSQ